MLNLGGTYRACYPEETLTTLQPLLSKTFGITRVANITGLDHLTLPTYIAIRPMSKHLTVSQGKGIDPDLAKISAIMESIEGWHAEQPLEPDLWGSAQQLKAHHKLVDLTLLSTHARSFSQEELHSLEIPWLKATELMHQQDIYIPLHCVLMDCTADLTDHAFFPTSNGLASGNTFEEAVCHGMYEVIERHAHSQSTPSFPVHTLDADTLSSTHIKQLIHSINPKTSRLNIINLTRSIHIPSFLATITDLTHVHAQGTYFGTGTHFSPEVALSRAITEAIQSRLTFISGSRDNLYPSVYRDIHRHARYDIIKPVTPLPNEILRVPHMPHNFSDCIELILKKLQQAGYQQVIVFNHTRPHIGIPVVHVFIPGLILDKQKHLSYAYTPDQYRTDQSAI